MKASRAKKIDDPPDVKRLRCSMRYPARMFRCFDVSMFQRRGHHAGFRAKHVTSLFPFTIRSNTPKEISRQCIPEGLWFSDVNVADPVPICCLCLQAGLAPLGVSTSRKLCSVLGEMLNDGTAIALGQAYEGCKCAANPIIVSVP